MGELVLNHCSLRFRDSREAIQRWADISDCIRALVRMSVAGARPLYRLITSVPDPVLVPTCEPAALHCGRLEIETAFGEPKTHLRARQSVLRSCKPDLMRKEFHGLLLTHFAVRKAMQEAAGHDGMDPDRLPSKHTVSALRRQIPLYLALPPLQRPGSFRKILEQILDGQLPPRCDRHNLRAVKRERSTLPPIPGVSERRRDPLRRLSQLTAVPARRSRSPRQGP